jgi:hypothetical protein
MFSSKLKSLTPKSSKNTSPVPPEFEVDDQIENYINDPVMALREMVMTKMLMFCRQQS